MTPTLEYIEQKFREFNKQIFNSCLPTPAFRLTDAKTSMGGLYFRKKVTPKGIWYSNITLGISQNYDLPQDALDDVIIHEMIHLYILSQKIHDTSTHGTAFRKLMDEINQKFNRHVTISAKNSAVQGTKPILTTIGSPVYFCVIKMKDGQTGIMAVAKTRIFELWRIVSTTPGVVQADWYVSIDPYFANFPKYRKPKFCIVAPSEYEPHLSGDTLRLENTGHTIRPIMDSE